MMEKGNWSILTGWLVWLIGFCVLLEVIEFKIRKHKTGKPATLILIKNCFFFLFYRVFFHFAIFQTFVKIFFKF